MLFFGFYINLDRSIDRRAAMEQQLNALTDRERYHRIAAIDGQNIARRADALTGGEIACFMSHALAVKAASQLPAPTHILEDDAIISPLCVSLLDQMVKSGLLQSVDILFTETYVPIDLNYLREYKRLFDQAVERDASGSVTGLKNVHLFELRGRVFAGMTSYLVSPSAAARISMMMEEELSQGPRMPVDLFVRKLIHDGTLRAKCIFPFVTSVRLESTAGSTISDRHPDNLPSVLATTLLRHSFFVGCNWPKVEEVGRYLLSSAPKSFHDQLLAAVCGYMLFGDYQSF